MQMHSESARERIIKTSQLSQLIAEKFRYNISGFYEKVNFKLEKCFEK